MWLLRDFHRLPASVFINDRHPAGIAFRTIWTAQPRFIFRFARNTERMGDIGADSAGVPRFPALHKSVAYRRCQ